MDMWKEFDDIVRESMSEKEYTRHMLGATISAEIINLRLDKGWTQKDLAERTGLKQSAISRIENNGVLPEIDTLINIFKSLDAKISIIPDEEEIIRIEPIENSSDKKIDNILSNVTNVIEEIMNSKFEKIYKIFIFGRNREKLSNQFFWQNMMECNFEAIINDVEKVNNSFNKKEFCPQKNITRHSIKDVNSEMFSDFPYDRSDLLSERGVEKEWNLNNYVTGLMN